MVTDNLYIQHFKEFLTSMRWCFDEAVKQLVLNLLMFCQSFLNKIHITKVQREASSVRSAA